LVLLDCTVSGDDPEVQRDFVVFVSSTRWLRLRRKSRKPKRAPISMRVVQEKSTPGKWEAAVKIQAAAVLALEAVSR